MLVWLSGFELKTYPACDRLGIKMKWKSVIPLVFVCFSLNISMMPCSYKNPLQENLSPSWYLGASKQTLQNPSLRKTRKEEVTPSHFKMLYHFCLLGKWMYENKQWITLCIDYEIKGISVSSLGKVRGSDSGSRLRGSMNVFLNDYKFSKHI